MSDLAPNDWRPSASLETLQVRAKLLAAVRQFFDERGYWEVDTPVLSHERVVDPHLEPVVASAEPWTGGAIERPLYLHTSPEFAMKRLIAAGAEAIYQVSHVFRAGERGRLHNPEFAMLEWYRVGDTHQEQMQVVEELVAEVCRVAGELSAKTPSCSRPGVPFQRTTYREAFRKHTGVDVVARSTTELMSLATSRGLVPPPGLSPDDRDGWLNWLLVELVERQLGAERPEFVYDYPASQAALAVVRREEFPVAERFELYWRGIELCNGYHELTDGDELEARIAVESARRAAEGLPALPVPPRLLAAMEAGLPPCAGVALGFDRLMMLAIGARSIDEVLPFAFERS